MPLYTTSLVRLAAMPRLNPRHSCMHSRQQRARGSLRKGSVTWQGFALLDTKAPGLASFAHEHTHTHAARLASIESGGGAGAHEFAAAFSEPNPSAKVVAKLSQTQRHANGKPRPRSKKHTSATAKKIVYGNLFD